MQDLNSQYFVMQLLFLGLQVLLQAILGGLVVDRGCQHLDALLNDLADIQLQLEFNQVTHGDRVLPGLLGTLGVLIAGFPQVHHILYRSI